ncbi:hypothetical protein NMG60_11026639 [Bertholletia excelsa]
MVQNMLSSIFVARFLKAQELFCTSLAGTLGMIAFFSPLALLYLSGSQMVRDMSRILQN